jgi:hypothetical protein
MFTHPRRTCDAFAGATMQQRPWKDNPMPQFQTLKQMQEWISPLLEEEEVSDEADAILRPVSLYSTIKAACGNPSTGDRIHVLLIQVDGPASEQPIVEAWCIKCNPNLAE